MNSGDLEGNLQQEYLRRDGVLFATFHVGEHRIFPETCSASLWELVSPNQNQARVPNQYASTQSLAEGSLSFPLFSEERWWLIRAQLHDRNLYVSFEPSGTGILPGRAALCGIHATGGFSACIFNRTISGQLTARSICAETPLLSIEEITRQLSVRNLLQVPSLACTFWEVCNRDFLSLIIPLKDRICVLYLPVQPKSAADCCLTPRETEMLQLASFGYPYRAIAQQLHVTEGTVKKTLFNARRKQYKHP